MQPISIWQVDKQTGFLLSEPLHHLSGVPSDLNTNTINTLEQLAAELPNLSAQEIELPLFDFCCLCDADERLLERLWLMYGYLANKYLHDTEAKILPEMIAKPFVQLSQLLNRPPILSYVGMVLTNWYKLDALAPFTPDNVDVMLKFSHLGDEAWFFRVHIAIEAQAGDIIVALQNTREAMTHEDDSAVLEALRVVRAGLVQITQTFHEMPDHCDSDVYFHQVRPYLFGYEGVIFEGVSDEPQHLRGGSGAQSSVIPAILGGMGLSHQQTGLTHYLTEIRSYMPQAHLHLIDSMHTIPLRQYCAKRPPLRDAYNNALRQLTTFRRAHLYYARTYIFEKSMSTTGTGGTDYLAFLNHLIEETAAQAL